MNEQLSIETEALADEIERYLAVVDAFRAAGCEPTWRAETSWAVVDAPRLPLLPHVEHSAH